MNYRKTFSRITLIAWSTIAVMFGMWSIALHTADANSLFKPAVNYGAGDGPRSVAIGNLNGDGHLDLAVANLWSDGVSVLLSNGDGTFQTAVNYAVGNYPGSVAIGDLNGDGKADMVSCWDSGLWYQDGANLAWEKVYSTAPYKVTCGDVTGDGQAEIIGPWSNGIWYRDVDKSKWTRMYSFRPDSPALSGNIAAGDFTGDGKADVASCWKSGLWYQNGATLGWTKVWKTAPYTVTAGDVTGDQFLLNQSFPGRVITALPLIYITGVDSTENTVICVLYTIFAVSCDYQDMSDQKSLITIFTDEKKCAVKTEI